MTPSALVASLAPERLREIPGASCMSLKQWFGEAVSCDDIRSAARARLTELGGASYDTLQAMRQEVGWP